MNNNENKTNVFSILGLIFIFFPVLGLIFSIIGLSKSKKYNSGKTIGLVGLILNIFLGLISGIIFVSFYFINLAFSTTNVDVPQQNIISTIDISRFYRYSINIMDGFEQKNFTLNSGLDVQFIISIEKEIDDFTVSVNDKYILSDNLNNYQDGLKVNVFGDYLLYKRILNGRVDLYVIDRLGNYFILNELSILKDINIDNVEISGSNIIVNVNRISNNRGYIKYNNSEFNLCDVDNFNDFNLDNNLVISATYTFKYENNELNLNPYISEEINLLEYLNTNICS